MNRSQVPAIEPLGHYSLPRPEVETLPGGLKFHYLSGGNQDVCRLKFYFVGGQSEFAGDVVSQLMLGMLSDGTRDLDASQIADILDYNGVRIGVACHGHYSSISFSMLTKRVHAVLPLIVKMFNEPIFPTDRLRTSCMRVVTKLENMKQEVSYLSSLAFAGMMMGEKHPMARVLTTEEIMAIDRDYISGIHRRMLSGRGCHVLLSGLLDDELISEVRSTIMQLDLSGSGFEPKIVPYVAAEPLSRIEVAKDDSFQCSLAAGIPTVNRNHPDYIPLRLTTIALGGYFGSRLMKNIREEKGLTYGISAALQGSQEGAFVKIGAQFDKSFTARVIEELNFELENLASNPPAGSELERLKLHAYTDLVEILDSPDKTLSYYATEFLVNTPPDYFDAQQIAIQNLTSDTISRIASRYLSPALLRLTLAGN